MTARRIVTVQRNHAGDHDLVCARCGFLGTAPGPYAANAEGRAAGHAAVHERGRAG